MITQKRLKELLHYNKDTGVFTWVGYLPNVVYLNRQQVSWVKHNKCKQAGYDNHGYVRISIDGVQYESHRLVFLYQDGFIPVQVDHIDHIRNNNRYSNLRTATSSENSRNRSLSKINTTGVTGVYYRKSQKDWRAKICVNYKSIDLGCHKEFIDAVRVRKKAEIKYRFHGNHGAKPESNYV